MRLLVCALLGFCMLLPGYARASEDSNVEERLRRLERLVEAQQKALTEKEKQIQDLQSGMHDQAKLSEKLSQIESGTYFQTDASKPADNTFKVFWKEGLKFETADKAFSLALGGRIFNDYSWVSESDEISDVYGEQEDSAYFRAARLEFGGTIYRNIYFKAQYDFASNAQGSDEFRDVYMGIKDLPWIGSFQVGQFKMPMGLEQLTSSKYRTFMESSVVTDVFTPSRNVGFQFANNHFDERFTWAVAAYKLANVDAGTASDDVSDKVIYNNTDFDTDDNFDFKPSDGNKNWAIGTRVTGTPYAADKNKIVHLGLAYQWQHLPNRDARIAVRPENRMRSSIISTGTVPATDRHLFGAEVALVYERWSFQAEWMGALLARNDMGNFLNDNRIETNDDYDNESDPGDAVIGAGDAAEFDPLDDADDLFINGFYAMMSVFVTEDCRNYKKSSGAFDRVKPKHNFDGKGHWGALELALRGSFLDLDDESASDLNNDGTVTSDPGDAANFREDNINKIRGGSVWVGSAGLNWYLNPNMRFMFNYSVTNYRANDTVTQGGVDRVVNQGVRQPNDQRADGHVNTFAMRFQVDF